MARPKKDALPEIAPDATEMLEEFYNAESLNPALESIKADLQITGDADVTVHVSKLNADENGNEMNVWKGDPDAYDLEQLAKKFGSGQYRIMVYMKIPTGQKVRKLNKIMGWILSPEDEAKRKQSQNSPVIQTTDNTGGLVQVLQEMMRDQRATSERMLAAISARPDPMQSMKEIAEVFKVLTPQPQPQREGSNLNEVLNAAKLIIEIGKGAAPSVPDGAGLEGVALSKGLDIVGKMFERATSQPPAPVARHAALPNPDSHEDTSIELTPDQVEQMNMLKLYLGLANSAAKRGVKPDDFANEHYENVPDETLAQLATDPDWFNTLVNVVPNCVNFRGWYEQVKNRLVANAVEDGVLTQQGELRTVDEPANPEGTQDNGIVGSVNAAPDAGGTPK